MNEPAPRREPVLLLDSNLLIALSIEDHVHREPARRWLAATAQRFATCPITQGALVRSWLRLGGEIQTARQAVAVLAAHDRHEFWTDDVSYVEVPMAGIVGPRQVTDAYLAHLARTRHALLATLDRQLAASQGDVTVLVPTG